MCTSNHRHFCVAVLAAIAFSFLVNSEASAQARRKRYTSSTWTPTSKPDADELVGTGDSKNAGDSKKKKKRTDSDTNTTSLNSGKRVRTGDDVVPGTPITGSTIPLSNGQTFTLGGGLPGSPSGRATTSGTGPVQLTTPGAPIAGMSMPSGGMLGGGGRPWRWDARCTPGRRRSRRPAGRSAGSSSRRGWRRTRRPLADRRAHPSRRSVANGVRELVN